MLLNEYKIFGMMVALNIIAEEIYSKTLFGPLEGPPICICPYPSEDNHYLSDGYPVKPEQIHDYPCLKCKVTLLFGCLSAYLTPSIHFHLDFY